MASGFGHRAQWFRNVRADRRVRVTVGGHAPAPAMARILSPAEADSALRAYTSRHPRAWNMFKPVIETTLGSRVGDQHTELPMVELRIRHAPTQEDE